MRQQYVIGILLLFVGAIGASHNAEIHMARGDAAFFPLIIGLIAWMNFHAFSNVVPGSLRSTASVYLAYLALVFVVALVLLWLTISYGFYGESVAAKVYFAATVSAWLTIHFFS